ncbi:hypothetical protein niasHT_010975 [Heterodera trifolii]|uniref:Uncharacterized protein n=1 Tax=Heterodera trifolii TaxID=157864 RepID=A0ABD2LGD1_9BILA
MTVTMKITVTVTVITARYISTNGTLIQVLLWPGPMPLGMPTETAGPIFANPEGKNRHYKSDRRHPKQSGKRVFRAYLCRGATFEDPTFEDPTFEDPTFEDPTFGDLTFEDPTFEDPTFEDPTFGDLTFEDPTFADIPDI